MSLTILKTDLELWICTVSFLEPLMDLVWLLNVQMDVAKIFLFPNRNFLKRTRLVFFIGLIRLNKKKGLPLLEAPLLEVEVRESLPD